MDSGRQVGLKTLVVGFESSQAKAVGQAVSSRGPKWVASVFFWGSGGMEKTYIVYIGQVNQAAIEVKANSEEEAREKGYAKWRREWAHSSVMSIEEQNEQVRSV